MFYVSKSTARPDILYFMGKKAKQSESDVDSMFSFLGAREGFERVRHGKYAFHCDEQSAFPIIHEQFDPHEICDLNLISFRSPMLIGFVVRTESPFRSMLATK